MKFKCSKCGEWHEGPMDLGFHTSYYWHTAPEGERAEICAPHFHGD